MIPQRTIKLVVIGAAGVGKTSMRGQYISQRFSTGYRATIGADFISKVVPVNEDSGEMVTLQIWDTAGQERFSSLSSAFFRGADAALLVFDVNAPDTLHALNKWWEEFKVHAPLEDDEFGSFCCVVVGNKVDLSEGKASRVSYEQAVVFMDTLVPPELYRDEEDFEDEDDPLSASQMTATPARINAKQGQQTHQLLSPASSQYSPHLRPKSRSKSIDPNSTRSLYASSSVSGLTIYHTPSSSVYDHYNSAGNSPNLFLASSYPPKPLPPLIIGSVGSAGSLGSLSAGNTSAVTLTPSNWDKLDSTRGRLGDDTRWSHRDSIQSTNGTNFDVRSRYDSINSVASSASAAESFFSAYSAHTHLSNSSSSSRRPPRSSSPLSWRPYPHSPSPAPPLKSSLNSKHSHTHSRLEDSDRHIRHTLPTSSSSTPFPHSTSSSSTSLHLHPRSHLRLEIEPEPGFLSSSPSKSEMDSTENLQPPDIGPRLFFASAKNGEGVNDVFEYIAKRVTRQWDWDQGLEQRRREVGEEDEFDYVRRDANERMPRASGRRRRKQRLNGIGNGNGTGNALNGLNGIANGVGIARSWSGGMTVNLSGLNGVVSSMGSMRGPGGSNCCSS